MLVQNLKYYTMYRVPWIHPIWDYVNCIIEISVKKNKDKRKHYITK